MHCGEDNIRKECRSAFAVQFSNKRSESGLDITTTEKKHLICYLFAFDLNGPSKSNINSFKQWMPGKTS